MSRKLYVVLTFLTFLGFGLLFCTAGEIIYSEYFNSLPVILSFTASALLFAFSAIASAKD